MHIHHAFGRTMLPAMIASAFLPYILPATRLRADQLVVYAIALVAIAVRVASHQPLRLPIWSVAVAYLLLMSVIWTSMVTWLVGAEGVTTAKILAGIENSTQPLAIILVVAILVEGASTPLVVQRLLLSIRVAVICLSINTLVAVASVFYDIGWIVEWFLPRVDGGNVWERAHANGRYSGIFNQPMESGTAYGVALLGWVYLASVTRRIGARWWLGFFFLFLGGLLSVSKVFVIGAIGMALCLALYTRLPIRLLKPASVIYVAVGVTVVGTTISMWRGAEYLLRLFDLDKLRSEGVLNYYTAGRFGSDDSTVKQMFFEVFTEAPITGFGYGTASVVDSAYMEFLYQGGIVALALYCAMLVVLGSLALLGFSRRTPESALALFLWFLVLGAGLGAPVLTLNRSSVIVWIVIGLAWTAAQRPNMKTREQSARRMIDVYGKIR